MSEKHITKTKKAMNVTPNSYTIKEARKLLSAIGITLAKNDGEYKVRIKNSPNGHGYFTNDILDAVETGKEMARRNASILI